MPFKCVFRTCRGNYIGGPRVSTFSFPKDEMLAKKWLAAIPRTIKLTKNSKVCELHFKPSDIVTTTSGWDSKTGKTITVRLLAPRLSPQAVPSCIPRVPEPENLKIVPKPRKPERPRVRVRKKFFKVKPQKLSCSNLQDMHSVDSMEENHSTGETERTSHTKTPAILYINPRSKDENDAVNMSTPKEQSSIKTAGLAVIPPQPSEMTVLYGPFETIEAAASLLHGTNATLYSLECDKSQDSTLNQVIKVEPPDSSEELSDNSTSFETESMAVDNTDINRSNHLSSNLEDSSSNVPDNSRSNSEKTKASFEDESKESDDLYFFKSLLPDLKNLSRAKKSYIRLKIQELIYKEVYNCNKNSFS